MLPALLLALALLPHSALAYQSFTASLSAYQGIQLSSGMTAFDPTVLTIIIGDATDIDRLAAPAIDPLFQFAPDRDVYFGFTTDAAAPIAVTAVSVTGIAVLDSTGFTDLTDDLLGSLDFTNRVVTVDNDDLAVLLLADGTTLFLEQISTSPDATISFTVWTPETPAVPEPATLLLFGVGVLVVVHIITRQHS